MPDSYIALAERGLFVQEWTNAPRLATHKRKAYQPVAVPAKPIHITALPDDLAALAKANRFSYASFSATTVVDVVACMPCTEPG